MSDTTKLSDQAMAEIRHIRNKRLQDCDWTQLPDSPADGKSWASYRQKLRDLPAAIVDVDKIDWPVPPA